MYIGCVVMRLCWFCSPLFCKDRQHVLREKLSVIVLKSCVDTRARDCVSFLLIAAY